MENGYVLDRLRSQSSTSLRNHPTARDPGGPNRTEAGKSPDSSLLNRLDRERVVIASTSGILKISNFSSITLPRLSNNFNILLKIEGNRAIFDFVEFDFRKKLEDSDKNKKIQPVVSLIFYKKGQREVPSKKFPQKPFVPMLGRKELTLSCEKCNQAIEFEKKFRPFSDHGTIAQRSESPPRTGASGLFAILNRILACPIPGVLIWIRISEGWLIWTKGIYGRADICRLMQKITALVIIELCDAEVRLAKWEKVEGMKTDLGNGADQLPEEALDYLRALCPTGLRVQRPSCIGGRIEISPRRWTPYVPAQT